MDDPVMFVANTNTDRPAAFDPLMLFAALSQHTNHIGLFATAVTTYDEPDLLARRFGSLDHLSEGRACWNIVTGNYEGDALNFGRSAHVPRDERYARADAFVTLCKELWESGARLPQGYPVLAAAGQSEPGRALAAKHAEVIFSVALTKPDAQAFYADLKERVQAQGRNPDHVRILPGVTAYVGRTAGEADELYAELQEAIDPAVGVASLSKFCRADLSGYPLDGPLPDLSAPVVGMTSYREAIDQLAKREGLTIRALYKRIVPSAGHVVFKGSATQVADAMEDWFRSAACDGFNVGMPVLPRSLETFIDLVIPELQRRGLFRTRYPGGTLRATLGLPTPERRVAGP
jgi:alkanesulfonate monooxygenase SsuD/methylene tetrahydromethanopterin reductase-like flavin-dependent oxidoreductase (luciferase family)